MTVETLTVPMKAKAKPAGSIGRGGHITQNVRGYSEWMANCVKHIKTQTDTKGVCPYAIVFDFYPDNFKCGDILNIAGSAMDALVKAGVLKDDSPNNISRVYAQMARSGDVSHFHIHICESVEDFISALDMANNRTVKVLRNHPG